MTVPLPTAFGARGILFAAALTGAFFAAPYSNLYFLLLTFLVVLGVLGVVWTVRNAAGLKARIDDLPPVPAGAGGGFHAEIDAGRRRRFQVRCVLRLDGAAPVAATAALVDGAARAEGTIPPLPRGVYAVRRASVESSYPLGMVRCRLPMAAPAELIVFPTPADLPEARDGDELIAGLCGLLAGVEGTQQPSSLREYRAGDELRSVNWRATARRGSPVVTQWEGEAGHGLEVALDLRAEPQAIEEALSLVAALALKARDDKERLVVHSQGLSATFGSEERPWADLLRFLAAAQPLPADGPAPPPVSPGILRLPLATAGGAR